MLERIMPLGIRHGTGVKPAVDNLRRAVHDPPAFGALQGDGIDHGLVQVYTFLE